MRFVVCILGFAFFLTSCSQKTVAVYPLRSSNPADSLTFNFSSISKLLSGRMIIGAGEATHGTHEFATARLALFKYLIRTQGYNTFFLEADYGTCLRINRYIHGESDTVTQVVKKIQLWPFMTLEMIEVVDWMREYNASNPPQVLSFKGCDMQFVWDDTTELKRLCSKYSIAWQVPAPPKFDTIVPGIDTLLNRINLDHWLGYSKKCKELFSGKILSKEDSTDVYLMAKGLEYFAKYYTNTPNNLSDYRDSCMGSNLLEYLSFNPQARIFFWAHNGHVAYTPPTLYRKMVCGYYLKYMLGEQYLAIGTEMNEGDFYAYSWNETEQRFRPVISHFGPAPNNTLPWILAKNKKEVQYLDVKNVDDPDKWTMTTVGAVYPTSKDGYGMMRFGRILSGFDGVIYIEHTSPTHLIR